MVFNTGPHTALPENSILITANMQSETGFPSSHQLKSYVAYKSRMKLAARAVLSADSDLLVEFNRAPCGLKGSGITFVRATSVILSSLCKFTGSFDDDVAVHSHQ